MPGRKDYHQRVQDLRGRYKTATGVDPLEYVSRPGAGEAPRYVFMDGTVKLGGPDAWAYMEGLMSGVRTDDPADAATQ